MEQQNENIIAAIDVGTTKIAVLVGRKDSDGHIEVLGYGRNESKGVRRGAVLNIEDAIKSIGNAVAQAEATSGYKITEAYVGIAGHHIRSQQFTQTKNRNSANDAISRDDIDYLIDQMREMPTEMGEEVLHILPQSYTVDGEHEIMSPVGMYGKQLSGVFHIIFGNTAAANNLRQCVERNGIKVKGLILEPLASSAAVLTDDDKELGVALVDIGGGTTDIAIYKNGCISHSKVIPFGGNSVTEDIRRGCNILERQAEGLKVQHGSALVTGDLENKAVTIPGSNGLKPKQITLTMLANIINARMSEIITIVKHEIESTSDLKSLGAGIVITGGGSMLPNLIHLFAMHTGCEVRIGTPNKVIIKCEFENVTNLPSNSTSIGLLMMGFENSQNGTEPELHIDTTVEDTTTTDETEVETEENDTDENSPKKGKVFQKLSNVWNGAINWATDVEDKQL
ncbi:MAG: cell division protein FtsA [Salinivirgaceae bacterium]|nr:cell division protein FtsA [Salinivirgaceae bacterium]